MNIFFFLFFLKPICIARRRLLSGSGLSGWLKLRLTTGKKEERTQAAPLERAGTRRKKRPQSRSSTLFGGSEGLEWGGLAGGVVGIGGAV